MIVGFLRCSENQEKTNKYIFSIRNRWIAAGIIGAIWLLLLVYLIKVICQ